MTPRRFGSIELWRPPKGPSLPQFFVLNPCGGGEVSMWASQGISRPPNGCSLSRAQPGPIWCDTKPPIPPSPLPTSADSQCNATHASCRPHCPAPHPTAPDVSALTDPVPLAGVKDESSLPRGETHNGRSVAKLRRINLPFCWTRLNLDEIGQKWVQKTTNFFGYLTFLRYFAGSIFGV